MAKNRKILFCEFGLLLSLVHLNVWADDVPLSRESFHENGVRSSLVLLDKETKEEIRDTRWSDNGTLVTETYTKYSSVIRENQLLQIRDQGTFIYDPLLNSLLLISSQNQEKVDSRWKTKSESSFSIRQGKICLDDIKFYHQSGANLVSRYLQFSGCLNKEEVSPKAFMDLDVLSLNGWKKESEVSFLFGEVETKGKAPIRSFKKMNAEGNIEKTYDFAGFQLSSIKGSQISPTVALIDGGFDLTHPDLKDSVWINPFDPWNGIDDDKNGLVDDSVGFGAGGRLPIDGIRPDSRDVLPFSHGTHIAGLALKDLKNTSWVGFADLPDEVKFYQDVSDFLNRHKIELANLSAGASQFLLGDRRTKNAQNFVLGMKDLIERSHETLFFVAAGNGIHRMPLDIDIEPQYPASWENENLLVVASMDASSFEEAISKKVGLASYSNYGEWAVDVAAPGVSVLSAALGGGRVTATGTSMATPMALNVALNMKEINPGLSWRQIKEIMMKTVWIADLKAPLPVRSGGMVHPERCLEVARRLLKDHRQGISDVILDVLKADQNSDEIQLRRQMWVDRFC